MEKNKYWEYTEKSALAVIPLSNWGGIEILEVLYGIEDEVIACFNFGTGRQEIRRHKIHTTPSGRAYIRKEGRRYYLDETMRV